MYASEVETTTTTKKNNKKEKITWDKKLTTTYTLILIFLIHLISSWPITRYVIQTVKPLTIDAYTKSRFAFWKKSLS